MRAHASSRIRGICCSRSGLIRATGTETLIASRGGSRYGTATPKHMSPTVFSSWSIA
jgi:hypothetical protein